MGHVAVATPLLLAGRARLDGHPELYLELVKALSTYCFRVFVLCNRRGHTGQSHFRRAARWLMAAEEKTLATAAKSSIGNVQDWTRDYANDEEVLGVLRAAGFYESLSSQEIRYLFYEYERELCDGQKPSIDWSTFANSKETQVEHIWPQAIRWLGGKERSHQENVHRLGNLTVTHFNQRLGTSSFADKKQIYARSSLLVENTLQHVDRWDLQAVNARESALVEFVVKTWPVPPAIVSPAAQAHARFRELLDPAAELLGADWQRTRRTQHYQAFWPAGVPKGLHYELADFGGWVCIEIHIESQAWRHIAPMLRRWAADWAPEYESAAVDFEPTWCGGLGRLRIRFPPETPLSDLVAAWEKMVARTRDTLWAKGTA